MPFVARIKMAFSCGHSGQTAVDNHLLTVYKKEVTRLPAGATKENQRITAPAVCLCLFA